MNFCTNNRFILNWIEENLTFKLIKRLKLSFRLFFNKSYPI